MPSVVWTYSASTLTFPLGIRVGTPHVCAPEGVVVDRLAGGAFVAYDQGLSDLETIDYTMPHCTQAVLDAFKTWKNTTVRGRYRAFTHTDNSKSPAYTATVRLWVWSWDEEPSTEPAAPHYTIKVRLQVEPS